MPRISGFCKNSNDLNSRAAKLRLIYYLKIWLILGTKTSEDFSLVLLLNVALYWCHICEACVSQTNIIKTNYSSTWTLPSSLHLHEVAGWTVEVAGCLRGWLRQAASSGSMGTAQMCEALGHPLR